MSFVSLFSVCNFKFLVTFDNIADLDVVASVNVQTAVLTGDNLLDIVLETTQGTEFAGVDDDTVADEADAGVALQLINTYLCSG